MSVIVESKTAGGRPGGYGPECEILNHGNLRASLSTRDGERPHFVRFQRKGRFLRNVTPDASMRFEGNSYLVRIPALNADDALATLEYHYGSSIDREHPITVETRTPVSILNGHRHQIVVWGAA